MKYGDRRINDLREGSGKVTISARVDMRKMSTCLKHFINIGYMPKTKSDLIDAIVGGYSKVLRDNKEIREPETNAEAYGFLRQYGLEPGTSAQGLRQALERDEITLERHMTASEIEEELQVEKMRRIYEERMKDLDTIQHDEGNGGNTQEQKPKEKKPTLPGTGGGIAAKVPSNINVRKES